MNNSSNAAGGICLYLKENFHDGDKELQMAICLMETPPRGIHSRKPSFPSMIPHTDQCVLLMFALTCINYLYYILFQYSKFMGNEPNSRVFIITGDLLALCTFRAPLANKESYLPIRIQSLENDWMV